MGTSTNLECQKKDNPEPGNDNDNVNSGIKREIMYYTSPYNRAPKTKLEKIIMMSISKPSTDCIPSSTKIPLNWHTGAALA